MYISFYGALGFAPCDKNKLHLKER